MEFKDSLRALRQEKGFTQGSLAEKLNISLKTVSHWETGYTEPSVSQLIALAELYGVSLDELVGREF